MIEPLAPVASGPTIEIAPPPLNVIGRQARSNPFCVEGGQHGLPVVHLSKATTRRLRLAADAWNFLIHLLLSAGLAAW